MVEIFLKKRLKTAFFLNFKFTEKDFFTRFVYHLKTHQNQLQKSAIFFSQKMAILSRFLQIRARTLKIMKYSAKSFKTLQ